LSNERRILAVIAISVFDLMTLNISHFALRSDIICTWFELSQLICSWLYRFCCWYVILCRDSDLLRL